jgi:hypothetical protein
MKSVMRMFAEEDKGVVFYETVLSLSKQSHTFIECVPVPWEHFDYLPGYFKVQSAAFLRNLHPLTRHHARVGIYSAIRA